MGKQQGGIKERRIGQDLERPGSGEQWKVVGES